MNAAFYLDPIECRYNPEHDMISDGPAVTWAEYNLAQVVKVQQAQIEALTAKIEKINAMFPSTAEDTK